MLLAWLVFPLVLAALATGCGLLLNAAARTRLAGELVPLAGLAVVIVAAEFATLSDATAELATPLVVALAVAGAGLSLPWRRPSLDRWAIAAAIGVFAVLSAPIVLSGEATFAGYIRLDDTATWMTLTDRVMEHGRSLDGLAPSTYEATLAVNLGAGYPVGVFLPLGIGHELVGTDVAWLVQPYLAFLAALLALALWALASPLVGDSRWRALAAFLGAQSALLVGYYLWGGIKELAAAALIASAAAFAGGCIRTRFAPGAIVLLAVCSAALLSVLSAGGAIWLAPIVAATAILAVRQLGLPLALGRALGYALLTLVLSLPVLVGDSLVPPTSSSLTSETAQGNLVHPLEPFRLFGIWPAGDFRADPSDPVATYLLIAVVAGLALIALIAAVRSRAWQPLIYVGGVLVAGLGIVVIGSPWVGGKALATASPALPFVAVLGAAVLWAGGRRVEAGIMVAAIAGGIVWSNALAYRDVSLAPRDQLSELEEIGARIAGEGPALMTEYQPYGARHFLRDADPESASELRRRQVPLLNGRVLPKGGYADSDRLALPGLLTYRTLVLRRSPAQSRPPSPYRLTWSGDYYDVWQRPAGAEGSVASHLGLGSVVDPGGRPGCDEVLALARAAGPSGRLAAVRRDPVVVVPVSVTRHPQAWSSPDYESALVPDSAGTLEAEVRLTQPGDYGIWLGGSVRPQVDVLVDGEPAGSVRHQLNNFGQYVRLGGASLGPGAHTIAVRFHGSDAHPGSGGGAEPIGPLSLSLEEAADTKLAYFDPTDARKLCGRRWDWIEVLGG